MPGVESKEPRAQAADEVGRTIADRYRLEAVLGKGSAGVVYRARDEQDGTEVAIKLLGEPPGGADRARSRFEREGKALMRLRHDNIVDLKDYGLVGDRSFLVMELLAGETLRDRIQRVGPAIPADAVAMMCQVLSALSAAHGRGMIHRDLKPANIFVVGQSIKLLDFGLVKFMGGDTSSLDQTLTQRGMVVGTPLYMAPEQGTGDRVDTRVDVYAAGCVLFELLTGVAPFRRDTTTETIRAHLVSPVPELPPLDVPPVTQAGLHEVTTRALAKDASHRYRDAAAMLQALEDVERIGRRLVARALWRRRRKWFAAPVAASVLVLGWYAWPGLSPDFASGSVSQGDPWAADAPPEIVDIRSTVSAGKELDKKQMGDLRAFRRLYPEDPRPLLLQGHHYVNRRWFKDAMSRYSLALEAAPGAKRDPSLLGNLIEMAGSAANGETARAMIVEVYGADALDEARRAAADTNNRGNTAKRLAELVEQLSAAER